jgi:hypothetical protein
MTFAKIRRGHFLLFKGRPILDSDNFHAILVVFIKILCEINYKSTFDVYNLHIKDKLYPKLSEIIEGGIS